MKNVELFKKHYKRLARESLIKSILFGCLIGSFALFSFAFIFWLADFSFFWINIIISITITFITTCINYYRLFKPTEKQLAIRLDELGLEERMLTMEELKNDNSYIAKLQREDTIRHLEAIKPSLIKLIISIPLIVSVVVSGLLGIGMTSVSALAANDVISSGKELVDNHITRFYDVTYEIEGDGEILGDMIQRVENNASTTFVEAVANDGYVFIGWYIALDGKNVYNGAMLISDKTSHNIIEVTENVTIFAVFQELRDGEDEGDGDEGDGESGEQGDPGEPGSSDNKGENNGDSPNQGSSSGNYNNNDYIIDGKTDYGDYIGDASQNATEGAKGDSNLSGKGQNAVGGYFGNIGN